MRLDAGTLGPVDGTCVHPPELPERVSWDLRPARWSTGLVIVDLPSEADGEVVCFAPPGAALYSEDGLAVAAWRRGVWSTETDFVAGRRPVEVDPLRLSEVTELIPSDFATWMERATAAHVEKLRAFAKRRPLDEELTAAATGLGEELESVAPGALERCHAELNVYTARTEILERQARTREGDAATPTPFEFKSRLPRFLIQALLFASLYALYRWVRPDGPAGGLDTQLNHLSLSATLDVLMWIYGSAHVAVAFTFLIWVFFRRNGAFDFVRNAVIAAAALSVVPYLFFATGGVYGNAPSHDVPASAIPTMPALHLSIALLVGVWGFLLVHSKAARAAWLSYPVLALAAVVASEPSDLLLSIVGGLLAAVAASFVAIGAGRLHRTWQSPRLPGIRLPHLPSISS